MTAFPGVLAGVLGGLCALGLATPAWAQPAAPAKPAKQCFYERNVNGWNDVDDRTVILSVSVRDRYLVKLFGPCPEIRHTLTLGVRNRGSDWICTDDKFDLFVQDVTRTGLRQCPVESMTPITKEEAAALTSKRRR
jgi:hypothetical protein